MQRGGRTLDRNIAEAVSKRISLQDKLFGEEFEKAKLLPAVVFEEYADKLRFHARRDRVDLDELYGEEAKKDGWKFALPNAVDEAFADDDPMLGDVLSNRLPPKFERSIGNHDDSECDGHRPLANGLQIQNNFRSPIQSDRVIRPS
jgi:hypothetical protein